MKSPEAHLAVANIRLMHMDLYSHATLGMLLFGVSKTKCDPSFFEDPIRDVFPVLDGAEVSELAELKKEVDLEMAIKGGQAASLVFMYAGIESCLVVVAKAIAAVSPKSFIPLLKAKQVSLNEALSCDRDELLAERIKAFLLLMERQSLSEITRNIFRLINDPDIPRGVFDESRVDRIEKLRNDCAHGRLDAADFSMINEDLEYLRQIAEVFIDIVSQKFDIPYVRKNIEDVAKEMQQGGGFQSVNDADPESGG